MRNNICLVLLLVFVLDFLSIICYGVEPDNVVLSAGDKAPYAGILFNTARAQRVNLMSIDLQSCTKVSGLQTQEETIMQQRITNLDNENTSLSQRLANTKSDGLWEKVGFFFLGSVLTGLTSYAVYRSAH